MPGRMHAHTEAATHTPGITSWQKPAAVNRAWGGTWPQQGRLMVVRPQWQGLDVSTWHVGHGPGWQGRGHLCPHGLACMQGCTQVSQGRHKPPGAGRMLVKQRDACCCCDGLQYLLPYISTQLMFDSCLRSKPWRNQASTLLLCNLWRAGHKAFCSLH